MIKIFQKSETINTHHHGEHTAPSALQSMLHPGLIRGRLDIARRHPVKQTAGAASRPAAVALQAAVASPHCAASVAAPQLASSSALGALFVVTPLLRATTPNTPPAGTPSWLVAVAFQAKMVALACSAAGLVSSLATLAEEQRLREEDRRKDGETMKERDGSRCTGASHAITIIIISNNNNNDVNRNNNNNNNNDNSNNNNDNDCNNNDGNDMLAMSVAPAAWTVTGCFRAQRHNATRWGRSARRTTK